jgi:hypothetical protein
MKNQPITPLTQPDTAELRAVSPFVRFLEASFFTEIFRRETLAPEARVASEVEPPNVPADPPKVRRAAAGGQQ